MYTYICMYIHLYISMYTYTYTLDDTDARRTGFLCEGLILHPHPPFVGAITHENVIHVL